MSASPLETAFEYARLGLPVHPLCGPQHKCNAPGKIPWDFQTGKHREEWQAHGIPSDEEIEGWLAAENAGRANIGMLCGAPSGLLAVDIDGETGERMLQELSGGDVPPTWEFTTGGGGRRLLYRIPGGVTLKTRKDIVRGADHQALELLADGSQTVLPPSVHPSSNVYAWVAGRDPWTFGPPALVPDWAVDKCRVRVLTNGQQLVDAGAEPASVFSVLQDSCPRFAQDWQDQQAAGLDEETWFLWLSLFVGAGEPDTARAFSEASSKHDKRSESRLEGLIGREDPVPPVRCATLGCDLEQIKRCFGTLRTNEAGEVTNSPGAFLLRAKRREKPKPPPSFRPVILRLADVEREEVQWVWYPYIPRRKQTLLDGDPGVGKSWFALWLAAALSRGWPLPGIGNKPGNPFTGPVNVVYMTGEDGLGDTLRPRLEILEADLSRIYALRGKIDPEDTEGAERPVSLLDVDVVRKTLAEVKPALVVVDPITAYIPGIDPNKANEVRPLLSSLLRLAEEYDCAFLILRHLTKGARDRALYRGAGSIDWAAGVRSMLLLGQDPVNKDLKVMVHQKHSLSPPGDALSFEIREGRFLWIGGSKVTAEDLVAPASKGGDDGEKTTLEEAKDFLTEALKGGQVPSDELRKTARKELGISPRSLFRAKQELGIIARKSLGGVWVWFFPEDEDKVATEGPTLPTVSGEVVGNLGKDDPNADEEPLRDTKTTLPSGGGWQRCQEGGLGNVVGKAEEVVVEPLSPSSGNIANHTTKGGLATLATLPPAYGRGEMDDDGEEPY